MLRVKTRALAAMLLPALVLASCGFGYSGFLEGIANKKAVSGKEFTDVLDACTDCDQFRDMFVADLHADSFLWGRDVTTSTKDLKHEEIRGHVDLERLRHAGVDLQVFGVPSMTPYGARGFDSGLKGSDPRYYDPKVTARDIGGLNCTNLGKNLDTARLLYDQVGRQVSGPRDIAYDQARRFCDATGGAWADNACTYEADRKPVANKLFAVRTKADLNTLLDAIAQNKQDKDFRPVGAMLAVEGVHWIKSDWTDEKIAEEITNLKNAGFGIIGPVHKFSNDLASSDEDCEPTYGLTPTGEKVLREVHDQGLILDLAHMSADTLLATRDSQADVLSYAGGDDTESRRWMIMSHGAIRTETCQNYRNLPAKHVAEMLRKKIPFGVIHWDLAFCLDLDDKEGWLSAHRIEQAIVDTYWRAVNKLDVPPQTAIQSLAIGADLDGGVNAPYDVRGFPLLLKRMSEASWCEADEGCDAALRRVAGENVLEFLMDALPEASSPGKG